MGSGAPLAPPLALGPHQATWLPSPLGTTSQWLPGWGPARTPVHTAGPAAGLHVPGRGAPPLRRDAASVPTRPLPMSPRVSSACPSLRTAVLGLTVSRCSSPPGLGLGSDVLCHLQGQTHPTRDPGQPCLLDRDPGRGVAGGVHPCSRRSTGRSVPWV